MAKNNNTSFIAILLLSGIAFFYLYKKNKNKKATNEGKGMGDAVTPSAETPKPETPIRVPSAVTPIRTYTPPPSSFNTSYLEGASSTKPSIASEPSASSQSPSLNPHLQPIVRPTRSISIASEY
jgi:hypothetical protein